MEQGTTTAAARRRPPALARGGVAAASVWETRMKMDEVKGGIKVFNAAAGAGCEEADDEEGIRIYRRLRRNQSDGGGGAAAAAKKRRNWKASEPVTAIGELRKSRSEAAAVGVRRARVGTLEKKAVGGEIKEVVVVGERAKASMEVEGGKEMNKPLEGAKNLEEETEEEDDEEEVEEEALVKEVDQDHMAIDEESVKSPSPAQVDRHYVEPPLQGIKTVPVRAADERVANLEPVKTPPENKLAAAIDLRSMNLEPMTPPQVEKKPTPVIIHRMTNAEPAGPSPEKKPSPVISRRIPKQEPVKTSPVEEHEEVQGSPSPYSRSNGRMQNIVDLVMWRDVSKSALVFGFGTFLLISSSYANDLNFNPITASSYLGLIYLGLRFLYKSILNRGACVDYDEREDNYLVGEDEAIWLLRLVLPYINEVLLNLRSLFSGEPATTMKLALLLFAMARCGNFVTLWTLAKLVFFGVFIIPKVCSSYSTQLARYGKFWLERFRDAWESCSHKKAIVAAVFTLVWNVSSTVARVWAVFMLVVAMKCYQQRKLEGWSSTAEEGTQVEDDEAQEEYPRKPGAANTQAEAQSFGVLPRHRRGLQVSGEIGRERLRVKGGIQPR